MIEDEDELEWNDYYVTNLNCPKCNKETPHNLIPSGHERDSYYDEKECRLCKYIRFEWVKD